MITEEKTYILSIEAITDKIAFHEYRGDNLIARGLYIAASISGIDISAMEFHKLLTKKINRLNNKSLSKV